MIELKNHQPNQKSIDYAKAKNISIDELKIQDPQTYKILNSQEILELDKDLETHAAAIFEILFKDRELFKIDNSDSGLLNKFLVFPELSKEELNKYWDKLNLLLEQKPLIEKDIYYRVLNNVSGEHHQLAFPIKSSDWQAQENLLVGPFDSKEAAETWVRAALEKYDNLDYDHIRYNNKEFLDIFSNSI